MASEVVSVTLEANISGKSTASFAKFDKLVSGLGKNVLNFRKHTDSITTSIKRLNTGLNRKSGFTSFDRKLVGTSKKTKALRKDITGLRGDIDKLNVAFNRFGQNANQNFSTANAGLQGVRRSALQTARAYGTAARAVANMRNQAGRSPRGTRVPNVVINPNQGRAGGGGTLGRGIQAAGSAFMMGQTMNGFGHQILSMGASMFRGGEAFEVAMKSLESRMSASETVYLSKLRNSAVSQGKLLGKLPSEIAASFEEMKAMGISAPQIAGKGGLAVNAFAASGNMSAVSSAMGLGQILSALTKRDDKGQVDFNLAGNLSDVLIGVGQDTMSNESEMIKAFEYATGAFNAAGLDYNMGALLIGAQSDIGRKGSRGGRDVAEYVARLQSRSGKIQEELGVNVKYRDKVDDKGNVVGQELDVLGATTEIRKALDALKQSDPMASANLERDIFGEQGQKAYLGIASGLEKINGLQKKIKEGQYDGITMKKAATATQTLKHDIIRLKASVEDFGESLLVTNRGPIRMLTSGLGKLIDGATWLVKTFPRLSTSIIVAGGAVGFLAIGLGALLSILGAVGFAIVGISSAASIIAPYIPAAAAAALVTSKWTATVITFKAAWAGAGAWIMGAMAPVITFLSAWWLPIVAGIAALWLFWAPIKAFFGGIVSGIFSIAAPVIDTLGAMFSEIGNLFAPILQWFDVLWGEGSAFTSLFGIIGKAIGKVMGTGMFAGIWVFAKVLTFALKTLNGLLILATKFGKAVASWLAPLASVFKVLFSPLIYLFEGLMGALEWAGLYKSPETKKTLSAQEAEKEKVRNDMLLNANGNDYGIVQDKLLDGGAVATDWFSNGMIDNGKMQGLIDSGKITNGDLLALRNNNGDGAFRLSSGVSPELQAALDYTQREYNKGAITLTQTPKIDIHVQSNATAEQIAEATTSALNKTRAEAGREARSMFVDDSGF